MSATKKKAPAGAAKSAATGGFDVIKHGSRDVAAINSGVWIDNLKGGFDLSLFVLGTTSSRLKSLSIELESSRPDGLEDDPEAAADRVLFEAREKCKAALLGWKNFRIGGEDKAFTPEYAATLIDDPQFEPFAMMVQEAMNRADKRRLKVAEATEKNSGTGTAGG